MVLVLILFCGLGPRYACWSSSCFCVPSQSTFKGHSRQLILHNFHCKTVEVFIEKLWFRMKLITSTHLKFLHTAEYDRHRVSLGVSEGSRDITSGKDFPFEHNLDILNGVSFSKGCYIGRLFARKLWLRHLLLSRSCHLLCLTESKKICFKSIVTTSSFIN